MKSVTVFLVTLTISSIFWGNNIKLAEASQTLSEYESSQNERAVLRYLWPTLQESGKFGRIYYVTNCQYSRDNPDPFPSIEAEAPLPGHVGLQAVQDIFRKDPKILVTERVPGIVRIDIGIVPKAILATGISHIDFGELSMYNADLAIRSVQNASEVLSKSKELGIRVPSRYTNQLFSPPNKNLPHLPHSMENITMDEVLDSISRTFEGIVVYGACTHPLLYTLDFSDGYDAGDPATGR